MSSVWLDLQSLTELNQEISLFCLFDLILYIPVNNFSVMMGRVFLGWTSTIKARVNVSYSRTQCSDAGEAQCSDASEAPTRNPSVSRQALYQGATGLPITFFRPVCCISWLNTNTYGKLLSQNLLTKLFLTRTEVAYLFSPFFIPCQMQRS